MNPTPTLFIGGTLRPVRFSFNALGAFTAKFNLSLSGMFQMVGDMRLDQMLFLSFCGLKDGARFNKAEFKTTPEEVNDWLSEDLILLAQIMDVFAQQISNMTPQAEEEEAEEDKKKEVPAS